MFNDRRSPSRFPRRVTYWLVPLLLVIVVAVSFGQSEGLRDAVDDSYRVLPAQGGVLLVPQIEADFEVIEIRNGDVVVDGQAVGLGELSARLGREEASKIRSLAELDSGELLELFEFEPPVEVDEIIEAAQVEVEAALEEAKAERVALLEEARMDRDQRAEQIQQELEEIEETHRAITEELRQRSRELKEHERERRAARRHRVSTGESRVVVGSSVVVHENEEVGEAVAIGGSVTVRGEVDGDAVAIGGRADIDGEVGGGVVSVGGSVHLSEDAEVQGDVVSVGGKIHRAPGAVVQGQTTEVSMLTSWLGPWLNGWDWEFDEPSHRSYFDGSVGDLIGYVIRAVLLGLVGLLLILFGRARLERAAAYAGAEPVKAGLVGFVTLVMSLPVLAVLVVVLAISIIGIPLILLTPFLLLGLYLFSLFGYLAVAYQLGRWSQQRFGWRILEPMAALVIGLFWLQGWGFMANLLDAFDGPRDFAGFLVILLGLFSFLVKLGGWSVGLGAMLLSSGKSLPETSALPPIPPAPGPTEESPAFDTLGLASGVSAHDAPSAAYDDALDVEGVVSAVWDEVQEDVQEDAEEEGPEDGAATEEDRSPDDLASGNTAPDDTVPEAADESSAGEDPTASADSQTPGDDGDSTGEESDKDER